LGLIIVETGHNSSADTLAACCDAAVVAFLPQAFSENPVICDFLAARAGSEGC